MPQFVQDMFTSAMGGGSIRRFGEMAVITLSDTALVTTSQEIQDAQRWARARNATTNARNDRELLLAQLQTLIVGNDTSGDTRGAVAKIGKLAGIMQAEGMDMQAWRLPQVVRDALPPPPPPPPAPPPLPLRAVRRGLR